MKPLIVVTSLLSGIGPTGVETHFNQIMSRAIRRDCDAILVNPYTGIRLFRAFFRPLKNMQAESAQVLYRIAQARSIQRQICTIIAANPNRPITIYAQCPLMAKAAVAARGRSHARVVAVVHYNLSEGLEIVAKGQGRRGGLYWRHLLKAEREALPKVDHLAFVSDFMRREVNARVPAIQNVRQETIFNFPPSNTTAPAKIFSGDLIAIGTLEARKNQNFVLRVLAEAKLLGLSYTLTVAGDGPDRASLEELAKLLNISELVRFVGYQPNASALIPHHRALVHAALFENCPIIVAEALSHSRPILAPAVGGIPEMFRHGIEGIHWNLDDPLDAAKVMIELLENKERYYAYASAAATRYQEKFSELESRWMDFLVPEPIAQIRNLPVSRARLRLYSGSSI